MKQKDATQQTTYSRYNSTKTKPKPEETLTYHVKSQRRGL